MQSSRVRRVVQKYSSMACGALEPCKLAGCCWLEHLLRTAYELQHAYALHCNTDDTCLAILPYFRNPCQVGSLNAHDQYSRRLPYVSEAHHAAKHCTFLMLYIRYSIQYILRVFPRVDYYILYALAAMCLWAHFALREYTFAQLQPPSASRPHAPYQSRRQLARLRTNIAQQPTCCHPQSAISISCRSHRHYTNTHSHPASCLSFYSHLGVLVSICRHAYVHHRMH